MNFLENINNGKNDWWRYLLFILIVIIANLIGSIPFSMLAFIKAIEDPDFDIYSLNESISLGMDKNLELVLMMLPFVASFLAILLLSKPMLGISLAESINGTNKIRWNKIFGSFAIWFLIMGLMSLIDAFGLGGDYKFQFEPINFLILVLISLIIIPIQTTTEEILFRSTLTRWVTFLTKSRLIAIFIPGILFGLVHISNPEVDKFGIELAMTQYVVMGLFLGLITILDDGLELAIGMHAANNIFASIFITFEGSVLQTYALFEINSLNPTKDLIALLIGLIIFIIFLSKKYKLNLSTLFKSLEFNNHQNQDLEQSQDLHTNF